jgi:cysteine desulfurase
MSLQRIYLDYNSTSPLSPVVIDWLKRGEVFWYNPSAQHREGKKAHAFVENFKADHFKFFSLPESEFHFIFHSGSTEGFNQLIFSWLQKKSDKKKLFLSSQLDHSCIRAQIPYLQAQGIDCLFYPLTLQGEIDLEKFSELLKKLDSQQDIFATWTWVQGELGVVWPLSMAEQMSERLNCEVHVDATQAPGKVFLSELMQAKRFTSVTFSAHKYGGLPGFGYTFLKKSAFFVPLIRGGGQQAQRRSGTENLLGLQASALALEAIPREEFIFEQHKRMQKFRLSLDEEIIGLAERAAPHAEVHNSNTLFLVFHHLSSDKLLPFFDLAGLCVGTGAACSSGAMSANSTLEALGYGVRAKNGIRLSFSPMASEDEFQEVVQRLVQNIFKALKS